MGDVVDIHEQGQGVQLSFEVGGPKPTTASIKMTGAIGFDSELKNGDEVVVNVLDADGVIVAYGKGVVRGVSFPLHEDKQTGMRWTERAHKIRLD